MNEHFCRNTDCKVSWFHFFAGSKRSSHSNAYFYGFYKNKRIVLFDTLIEDYKPAESEEEKKESEEEKREPEEEKIKPEEEKKEPEEEKREPGVEKREPGEEKKEPEEEENEEKKNLLEVGLVTTLFSAPFVAWL